MSIAESYGWLEAQRDLAAGVHPTTVAARLGEPEDYVHEVAAERGWPVTWQPGRKRWPLTDMDA